VGRALSKKLGWTLVDLDSEIEHSEKMTVQQIFAKFGEPHFRQLEGKHLESASARKNAVIALGGGAYVSSENREVADASGLTVWLKADLSTILQRVKIDGTRPLFSDNERAERLYQERLPSYALAKLHVETDNRSPEAVAAEIIARMERR
jgi:shikimate kinase